MVLPVAGVELTIILECHNKTCNNNRCNNSNNKDININSHNNLIIICKCKINSKCNNHRITLPNNDSNNEEYFYYKC